MAAEQRIEEIYRNVDLLIVEHPELSRVVAAKQNYPFTTNMLASAEGIKRLAEINFLAYMLNVIDETERLRKEHGIEVFRDEDFLIPLLSNPNAALYWNDPGIRHWYSKEFQRHVDATLKDLETRKP